MGSIWAPINIVSRQLLPHSLNALRITDLIGFVSQFAVILVAGEFCQLLHYRSGFCQTSVHVHVTSTAAGAIKISPSRIR